MKWVIGILTGAGLLFGIINGRMSEITQYTLEQSGEAVNLCISLAGIMCLWCGLMRVADKSGLLKALERLLSPITRLLFKGLSKDSMAMKYIVMNIASNLLGLGNASTPLGISAIKALHDEEKAGSTATANMIMLVVINTASLQIIPTTVAALRLKNGSQNAMEITPAVWIVSILSLFVAVLSAKLFAAILKRRKP